MGAKPGLASGELGALLDLATDALLVAECDGGRILFANSGSRSLLGIGSDPTEVVTLASVGLPASVILPEAAAPSDSPRQVRMAEVTVRRPDGTQTQLACSWRHLTARSGQLVAVALRPPTVHAGQPADDHARRLEQIGLLAGGIAHDFNNLLTGILGQASIALALLPEESPARGPIHKAAGAAGRAAELTRHLLAYAGKGQFRIGRVDLNELIIENIGLQETALPPRVRLALDLDPRLPAMLADRSQMQQVLMNLVTNAAEALAGEAEGGQVRVATSLRRVEATAVEPSDAGALPPGDYVSLEVEDTGAGMSPDVLSQIFDPFFSTKGSGRGLGLSATRGIVRAHRGGLVVATSPGQGTRFQVLLPADAAPVEDTPAEVRPPAPKAVRGSVLVIDDEPAVREVTCDMLAAAGIPASAAADGPDGLARYAEGRFEIGLVLLDMQMPGMSGEETMAALLAIDPRVRVIVISGYGQEEALRRFTGSGTLGFLQKPYDYATLVSVVSAALG